MGTDNLFHRRKAKSFKSLQRKKACREPYQRLLIVCEGEKTEPYYFKNAREFYALNTVNVEVRGDCGSAPKSVAEFAKERFKEEKEKGDPFDKVFCVFDKDGHESYAEALKILRVAEPKNTFRAINSVPCFEYWLLLHFVYSTKPYISRPRKSAGAQVESELKDPAYLPQYKKGMKQLFSKLSDKLEFAIQNAERVSRECERSDTDNPSTRVHELVKLLKTLKQ